MKSFLPIVLICIYGSLLAQDYNCSHHAYSLDDTIYVWKYDGVEFKKAPNKNANIISLIAEGEKVIVIEKIESYSEKFICFKDTILNDPLLVISSPYIKVKYNGKTGYVLEHYLNKRTPFNLENYLDGASLIFRDKIARPGDYSEAYEKIAVFNNGIIIRESYSGKVGGGEGRLIPYINHTNFLLIVSKHIHLYGNKEESEVKFSHKLNNGIHSFSWTFSGDGPGEGGITLTMNPFGMVIEYWEMGC